MSSASQLASEIGWDDGWEIPVANDENKRLTAELAELRRYNDKTSGEMETVEGKVKNLESHLKSVRDELTNTLHMRNTRKKEFDTERHFSVVAERENGRLQQLARQHEKQLEELRLQRNSYENQIYSTNNQLEELKNQMQWDQHALEAWLEESARRDEDALVIQKFAKHDESKIKELQLSIEKLTEERNKARKALETETTDTLSAQIELEKIADEFRTAHNSRKELIDQWESSINSMKQRDREIKHEQDHLEKINEDIVSRQLMIKEKRAFLATESENNIELEKKIEIRERQNGKLREQKQYIEERTVQLGDDVKTLQYQADRSRKDNDVRINQVEEKKLKIKTMETKLSKIQKDKRNIEEQIQFAAKGHLSAAEAAKEADKIVTEKEAELKDLESQRRRARDIVFKKAQELQKVGDEEKNMDLELHGAKTGIRNLKSRLQKLDQESLKSQEIIYSQDFNIAQLERRIARMQGEGNNEEKQALEEKVVDLNKRVSDKQAIKKTISEQLRKLQDNLRRVHGDMESLTREHQGLNAKIEELELYDDSSQRIHRNLIKEKQNMMVEDNILKLQVKKLREHLEGHADSVLNLEQRKLRLETALKERKAEIVQHDNKLVQELKHAGEIKSQLSMEVHHRIAKIDKLKKRYEIITMSMVTPEGEEEHSQAYHVIKAAQEKEALQRQGDELHAKIQKAEMEIDGLENTLRLINGGNDQLRRSLKKVGDDDEERQKLGELENQHRSVLETLRYKQRVLRELEEDLMLLQRDLAHNESVHAQIHAELDAIEANRAQLQKELDLHSEKVNRVNRQISRLDKEVTSKCGTDAEFLRSDVKLKSLREVSRQTLRTIGEIKESQPDMSYEIEVSIHNCGLRLPSPSPAHSPATSARLSARSSISSRSALSHRSTSTVKSDRLQTNTVEIGLHTELPSPPNSVTSARSNGSIGSARSIRSNSSRKKDLDKN